MKPDLKQKPKSLLKVIIVVSSGNAAETQDTLQDKLDAAAQEGYTEVVGMSSASNGAYAWSTTTVILKLSPPKNLMSP